jgi:hypothetical protein
LSADVGLPVTAPPRAAAQDKAPEGWRNDLGEFIRAVAEAARKAKMPTAPELLKSTLRNKVDPGRAVGRPSPSPAPSASSSASGSKRSSSGRSGAAVMATPAEGVK